MPIIYHYCDPDAFQSIIQNDCIRLCSVRSMNDSSEISYFRGAVLPAVTEAIKRVDPEPTVAGSFVLASGLYDYYASCFSTEADDLYQWQAYGQRGAGFAIGFESDLLCPYRPHPFAIEGFGSVSAPVKSANPAESLGLCEVIYAAEKQISSLVTAFIAQAERDAARGRDAILDLAVAVARASAVIKNRHFVVENEWRLLHAPVLVHEYDEVKKRGRLYTAQNRIDCLSDRIWRTSRYGLSPYYEYKDIKKAVSHIVVGPTCVENRTGSFLGEFLSCHGIENVKITNSAATLR